MLSLNDFYKSLAGFTLIEILFTLIIITVVFVPFISYFANSINFLQQTEIRAQALQIAYNTMERIKSKALNDFDSLNLNNYNDLNYFIDNGYKLKTDNFIIDPKDIAIDLDGDGNNDGKLISVEVKWGTYQKVFLESFIGRGL